ncbi:GNAT family N-acetyltransferase [Desulfolutivibrio sulfoxidireducens]|nr:GNAT family N-acetyltransferase [Desulfolutivibrio sulfoxidireducens]
MVFTPCGQHIRWEDVVDNESRVVLVPLDREHLDASRRWANDPVLNRAMLRALPASESGQERWYAGIADNPEKMVFAVIWRADGRHIGNTGLYGIDWLHRRADFWILIGEADYRGQGVGSEVTARMRRFAFDNLGLNRLCLRVDPDNAAAVALYASQGFVREGVLRQDSYIEGRFRDILIMSQLKREYEQQKRH